MIVRMIRFEVRKESVPQAVAAVKAYVDEVARKEGGTAYYKAYQHVDPPTRFTLHMAFRTPSAEDYHRKTAWHKRFQEALAPLVTHAPQAEDLVELTA